MQIEKTKYNLRKMYADQLKALSYMMQEKGCKKAGYTWLDVSIDCRAPNDYYMYIDENKNVYFGYGDHVFNRCEFRDYSFYGI